MAAQKEKKKTLLGEIFSILECLLTQNPTNQDSQVTPNYSYLTNYPKTRL